MPRHALSIPSVRTFLPRSRRKTVDHRRREKFAPADSHAPSRDKRPQHIPHESLWPCGHSIRIDHLSQDLLTDPYLTLATERRQHQLGAAVRIERPTPNHHYKTRREDKGEDVLDCSKCDPRCCLHVIRIRKAPNCATLAGDSYHQ
jgi:hypothetical protein